MNNSILSFLKRNFAAQFLAILLFLLLSFGVVKAVTTISTNISTEGTMTITGVSTLSANLYSTGGALFNKASTTVFQIQNGSGTNVFQVNTTVAGASITGTLGVSGVSTLGANLYSTGGALLDKASTTAFQIQNGSGITKFVVNTTDSTATSTGVFSVGSDSDTATSTLQIGNSETTRNGCIEMEREGAWYRVFINPAGNGLTVESGSCRTDKTGVLKVK
jgi:hypothetical protein